VVNEVCVISANEAGLEDQPLPYKMKPILLALAPNIDGPWWAHAVAASVVGFYSTLPAVESLLLWAIIFDLGSGLACGWVTRGGIRARPITRGVLVKGLAFALVHYLGGVQVEMFEMKAGLAGTVLGTWYWLGEWISVVENLDELGMPLPRFVIQALAKARETIGRSQAPGTKKVDQGS
jgi:phage-related holin